MKTQPPIHLEELPGESNLEYTLRVAAALIRQHALAAPVFHMAYDDDKPVTGEEVALQLESELEDIITDRDKNGRSVTILGKIIQAGGLPNPTLTLSTFERELHNTPLPLYQPCEIRFTPSKH